MLNENTLYVGDCLELMQELPDKSVDFCFADPPYGINKAEWDCEYKKGFELELLRISKNGTAITCGQENIADCIYSLSTEYKGVLCARNKNGMTYNKIGFGNWIPVICAGNVRRGQDFIEFTINGEMPDHPSPKPYDFMRKIILRFTNPNDLILDPFCGSGTTCVAAKMLGRRYIGIDIEPKYIEIAQKRLDAVQPDLFIDVQEHEKPENLELFK